MILPDFNILFSKFSTRGYCYLLNCSNENAKTSHCRIQSSTVGSYAGLALRGAGPMLFSVKPAICFVYLNIRE